MVHMQYVQVKGANNASADRHSFVAKSRRAKSVSINGAGFSNWAKVILVFACATS